jgi:hypothetical protein
MQIPCLRLNDRYVNEDDGTVFGVAQQTLDADVLVVDVAVAFALIGVGRGGFGVRQAVVVGGAALETGEGVGGHSSRLFHVDEQQQAKVDGDVDEQGHEQDDDLDAHVVAPAQITAHGQHVLFNLCKFHVHLNK